MKTLKETAGDINAIEDELGITLDDVMHKFTQETGEFNDAIQKFRGRYAKTKYSTLDEVKGELGDVIANLISICNRLGINPDEFPAFADATHTKFVERKALYRSVMNGTDVRN